MSKIIPNAYLSGYYFLAAVASFSAYLMESSDSYLMEDGSSFYLLESSS